MVLGREGAAKLRTFVVGVAVGLAMVLAPWYGAARAADGRAFELVSPPDKNGGDIPGDGTSVTTASGGDAVAYTSRASFGDTAGAGPIGQTMYVARRGSRGWIDHAVTPQGQYDTLVSGGGIPLVVDFSTDLANAVVWAYDLPGVSGQVAAPNIYAEDTATDNLTLVTQPLAGPQSLGAMAQDYLFPNPVGVSEDSRHVAFTGRGSHLLPEAPLGVPSVYEWDSGRLRLASVLPDGSIASTGALLALPNRDLQQAYRQTVSPDGSRVFFMSPTGSAGQLYERVDHSRTVWISQPETTGPAPTPQNVLLQDVTGDSRHVIFTTSSQLVEGDTDGGSDIYMYTDSADPARDSNLTLVGQAPGRLATGPTPVVGASDDGSRIYYATDGGAILVWYDGQTAVAASNITPTAGFGTSLSATASTPGAARVTSDGRYMAFMGSGAIASGGAKPLIGDNGGHQELYLYDAVADQLRCVSCPASGPATADASVIPSVTTISPTNNLPGTRPSFLASDGRVFFSTTQALVPEDVNGVSDVYEFDPATGSVKLLSSGTGSDGAGFVGASASGNDVFFVTRQQLVQADRDGYADLYDARVGGGFADQPPAPPPCDGDACQGAVAPPPGAFAPGSLGLVDSTSAQVRPASGRLRVVSARVVGTHAALRIAIPTAGRLSWSRSDLRSGSRRFSSAGTYRIQVDLTPRARTQLRHRTKLLVRVRITFAPADGARISTTATLTFKGSLSKKGR